MLPYGIKVPISSPYIPSSQMALELHRAQQFYDYSARMQYGIRGYPNALGLTSYQSHPSVDHYLQHYLYKDPRIRYLHEEPKPNHSYIGLIAMAILSSRDKKLVLSDIYQWILDNYPYFRTRGPGWRNSIRHNLSLNDCFIKSGRSANGKGHYWAIHPANIDDFQKGDFRRRRAQRRVRRHMGLAVPDDDESPVPSPSDANWVDNDDTDLQVPKTSYSEQLSPGDVDDGQDISTVAETSMALTEEGKSIPERKSDHSILDVKVNESERLSPKKRRNFDMDSLLAPDDCVKHQKMDDGHTSSYEHTDNLEEGDIDVVTERTDSPSLQSTSESSREKENVLDLSPQKEEANQRNILSKNKDKNSPLFENSGIVFNSSVRGFTPISPHSSTSGPGYSESWNSLNSYLPAFPVMGLKNGLQHSLFLSRTISQIQQNRPGSHIPYRLHPERSSRLLPEGTQGRQITN